MSTSDHESLISQYIEAVWNQGQLDLIDRWWIAERAAECRANWLSNHQFCPEGLFSIQDVITQGDKVVVRWSFEGTLPHAASHNGRALAFTGISIWRLQDGRFIDSHFESEGPGVYE